LSEVHLELQRVPLLVQQTAQHTAALQVQLKASLLEPPQGSDKNSQSSFAVASDVTATLVPAKTSA
jgi:hypothetical protein